MTTATTRRDSTYRQLQKRVPADIVRLANARVYPITLPACDGRPEELVEITIRPVIKCSLRVRQVSAAKLRTAAFVTQLEKIFISLRAEPTELSHKQTVALSGEIYRLVLDRFETNPGEPEMWEAWKAFTWAAVEGRVPNPPTVSWHEIMDERQAAFGFFRVLSGPFLLDVIEQLPPGDSERSLEVRFGLLATWVLARHGLEVTSRSRLMLLKQVAEAAFDVGWRLKRAARGDYTPDPKENRFPPVEARSILNSLSIKELFERWRSETKPEGSTLTTWRSAINDLCSHLNHENVAQLTKSEIISWKDKLVARELSSGTINGSYLACLNAILSFGVRNELIPRNIATGVKVLHKERPGTSRLPYEDQEVAQLLRLASKQTNAARRWIPLLAACSGARAGELAQLWAERVREVNGILIMELRPAEDGGSLKNEGSERQIPLHPALLAAGFMDFVEEKKRGPLFYGRPSGKGARHPSKGVVNHLGDWIREQPGFDNPRKAPSHAFRHWWKSTASRVGIPDSRADAIQGHKTQGEAARYRHFDLQTRKTDIEKIVIPVNGEVSQ